MTGQDALVRILVDLAEGIDHLNTNNRFEAEVRADQRPVPITEVTLLGHLLRHPGATLAEMTDLTFMNRSQAAVALASLQRRGLVEIEAEALGSGQRGAYVVTQAGVDIRNSARDRAAHRMRYALAALSSTDQAVLQEARDALDALSAALGYRDIDPRYRTSGDT